MGYSQGGAGALCAVTNFDNGKLYKTIFTGSAAYPFLAHNMGWDYDVSKEKAEVITSASSELLRDSPRLSLSVP